MVLAAPADAPKPADTPRKVTVPDVRSRKAAGVPLAMVTAYDYTMARLVDEAGVDLILVGDSLGMVVQGHANTLPVTVDEVCYHGRAVARAALHAHVVGDLPFMSYQVSPARALESAGRLVKEGAFESVKMEGGSEIEAHLARVVKAGIPVMGHVGLEPQRVHSLGGFKVQGRGKDHAARIISDARAVEAAGAYAVVLESVPPDLAEEITRLLNIPTIGIGAGVHCDGQVLVCTDLLGMTNGPAPRFVKRYAEVGVIATEAVRRYVADVQSRAFPGPEHTFKPNEPGGPGAASRPAPEARPSDLRH